MESRVLNVWSKASKQQIYRQSGTACMRFIFRHLYAYKPITCPSKYLSLYMSKRCKLAKIKRLRYLFNKAGYTATSCGRVGRGGNMRFPTF